MSRSPSRLTAALGLAVAASVLPAPLVPARAASAGPTPAAPATRTLTWSATLNGRDVGSASAHRPVRLVPTSDAVLTVRLENTGSASIAVSSAVVEGRVIGLPFFSYRTRMKILLPAGQSTQRTVPLDMIDLGDQANGLIPARVRLLGPDREVLASQSFVADVRGRLLSVYGVFALIVAALAGVLAIGLLFALWRGRLVDNRWHRGMQFLPVGAGVGLTGTFTLSALRLLAPGPGVWFPLVLVCCAAAFVLGYLTPTPAGDGDGGTDGRAGRWAPAGTALTAGGAATALAADHAADDPGDAGAYDRDATGDAIDLRAADPTADPLADWPFGDDFGQSGRHTGGP